MLTLPKNLDQPVLAIVKPFDPIVKPSFYWSTPREFIGYAAFLAEKYRIFIPKLFCHTRDEPATDNAIMPTALAWSSGVIRRTGNDAEMFDSLYAVLNHFEFDPACDKNPQLPLLAMFYAGQAMHSARHHVDASTGEWGEGLFEHFDFHIASMILSFRYHADIGDVLREAGISDGYSNIAAFKSVCKDNRWTPADFANEMVRRLDLPEHPDSLKRFPSPDGGLRPSDLGDEYRALIWIINREALAKERVFIPSYFERDLLKIRFDTIRPGGEWFEKKVSSNA